MSIVKPGSAEDRLNCRDVIERYCDAVTRHDWAQFVSCYAQDAVWQELDPINVRAEGRDEIAAVVKQMTDNMKHLVMLLNSCVVEIDGDKARMRSILQEVGRNREDTDDIIMFGIYEDDLARCAGGWRFTNRVFRPLYWKLPENLREELLF